MAKNTVEIDVKVDDKGTTKKVGLEAKKTAEGMDKASKSAGTLDRNMKGVGQASSGAGKNFSKMSQGMGGLVGTYATLAATVFAVSAAFQFLKSAADYKSLIEGQKALGAVTGVAYKTISNSLVEATNGQLKYAEAAKAAAIGTASGLSPSQLARLGTAAKNTSIALGRDLGDSFDRLIRGVTKAEPELLDELGIILRLEAATSKYGLKIGKAAGDLNEFERSQAVANEVLEQAERKFGALEAMMSPQAQALNRFSKAFDDIVNSVKEGISGPISYIAEFLSNNLLALMGTLSLFATGILKQILPSMSAWKASSRATIDSSRADQKLLQADLEKSAAAYVKLKKAQQSGITQTTSNTLSGATGSKSGTGAIDFLKGNTTSKSAQNAADKALTNAQSQLTKIAQGEAVKRTGLLAKYNAAQVADMRASYNARAAIIKEGEVQFKRSLIGMSWSWKNFKLVIASGTAAMKVGFASLGAGIATVGVAIGAIFFWVSTIALVVGLFYELGKMLFPTSEATAALNKETDSAIDKYKTLSEEIKRTTGVLADYGKLSIEDRITAKGNAIASIDVEKFTDQIEKFNKMDPKADGWQDLKNELLKTSTEAAKLDYKFIGLGRSVLYGTSLTDDQKKSMLNLSNTMQQAKINLEKAKFATQDLNSEFQKLVTTIDKPFGTALRQALGNSITVGINNLQSLGAELNGQGQALEDLEKSIAEKEADLEALSNKKPAASSLFSLGNVDSGAADKKAIDALKKEIKGDKAAQAAQKLRIEEDTKSFKEKEDALSTNLAFQAKLSTVQTELNRLYEEESTAKKDSNKMRTVGITYAQKMKNIDADNLLLTVKTNKEQAALIVTQALQTVLLEKQARLKEEGGQDLSKMEKDQLTSLTSQLTIQTDLLTIAEDTQTLGTLSNRIAQENLAVANKATQAAMARLEVTKKINEEERKLAFIKAGGTGSFGVARAREAGQQQEQLFSSRTADTNQEVEVSRDKWATLKARGDLGEVKEEDVLAGRAAYDASLQKQAALKDEIALYQMRGKEVLLTAKAETEATRAKLNGLSLNPVLTEFNRQMQENKLKNISLSKVEQSMLYAQIKANMMLNQVLELKSGIFDSLETNITNTFASIVDGSKSAKEAFGSMAINILADISQMIVRMIIMRTLMSAFMMMAPTSSAKLSSFNANASAVQTANFVPKMPTNINYPTPGTRYGGIINSSGKKLPGYAVGGIASGSQGGYPVTLHGTEAVVPLPNGKSIPVDMKNGSAQNNSVVVNVSMDGSGASSKTEQQKGEGMGNLGNAIAQAVQQELQNQKRSGGILNPYGVA